MPFTVITEPDDYEARVAALEAQGISRSDAQGIVDAEELTGVRSDNLEHGQSAAAYEADDKAAALREAIASGDWPGETAPDYPIEPPAAPALPAEFTAPGIQSVEPTVYPHVTVEHNHGVLELENARVFRRHGYRYIGGKCVGGGQTARLFSATHYTPFKTGEHTDWCIGSSGINGGPDRFYVSAVFL